MWKTNEETREVIIIILIFLVNSIISVLNKHKNKTNNKTRFCEFEGKNIAKKQKIENMHCENLLSKYIKIFKEENNSKQIYNSSKKKNKYKKHLKTEKN